MRQPICWFLIWNHNRCCFQIQFGYLEVDSVNVKFFTGMTLQWAATLQEQAERVSARQLCECWVKWNIPSKIEYDTRARPKVIRNNHLWMCQEGFVPGRKTGRSKRGHCQTLEIGHGKESCTSSNFNWNCDCTLAPRSPEPGNCSGLPEWIWTVFNSV